MFNLQWFTRVLLFSFLPPKEDRKATRGDSVVTPKNRVKVGFQSRQGQIMSIRLNKRPLRPQCSRKLSQNVRRSSLSIRWCKFMPHGVSNVIQTKGMKGGFDRPLVDLWLHWWWSGSTWADVLEFPSSLVNKRLWDPRPSVWSAALASSQNASPRIHFWRRSTTWLMRKQNNFVMSSWKGNKY